MIRSLFLILLFALSNTISFAQTSTQIYKTASGKLSFFSETPLENISATSNSVISAINPSNRNVAAVVTISTFKFKNALMQEHFNEKYLESDKYPKATFSGIINETVDLMTPGTYQVSVTGKLTIHGVEQNRTIKGTITIDAAMKLSLKSEFEVKLVDHKIQVPELVFQKIAEVITVKLEGEYKLQ